MPNNALPVTTVGGLIDDLIHVFREQLPLESHVKTMIDAGGNYFYAGIALRVGKNAKGEKVLVIQARSCDDLEATKDSITF